MKGVKKIAILGGGEEELNILSEFHRNPAYRIVAIYDRDPMAVALEIAEIIGIPKYTDNSFIDAFRRADYIIVSHKRVNFDEEIRLIKSEKLKIVNPSEAVNHLAIETAAKKEKGPPWPKHLESALNYITRITDRERLLKWLLEIAVRAVRASSGSIMLYSSKTDELYIGYANGLSPEIVKNTRQKIGEGIAGEVARTRKSRLIQDDIEPVLYGDERERENIQTALSVPLICGNDLLGVLNVSTNKGEKRLTSIDVDTIKLLADKISPILEQHLKIDTGNVRETEYRIRSYLETLFRIETGFHQKFSLLCRNLAEQLEADTVTIYTATDEGDWLILGGSAHHAPISDAAPRIHCIKGSLAKSFLNAEEILLTEAVHEPSLQLSRKKDSITTIYMPLLHKGPLGVIVLEFSMLGALERFLKLKDTLRFQVSFFVYSQLREIKQMRKMRCFEELSALTPFLMGIEDTAGRLKHLPSLLSSLVGASMGSFYFATKERRETTYSKFPDREPERSSRTEYDADLRERVISRREPECISFLPYDVAAGEKLPTYSSAILYPFFVDGDFEAVFIGYDKTPETPLDSSIFGEYELGLLSRVKEILVPILRKKKKHRKEEEVKSFNDLLKSNQKIFLERIEEEIERAERYHHGFTVTLFRVYGLTEYYKVSSHHALDMINRLSVGLREMVRKTDYFSWIETDLFGILSLESFQRVEDLEKRLIAYIESMLDNKGFSDRSIYSCKSGFALFPGDSETPSELIAKAKLKI